MPITPWQSQGMVKTRLGLAVSWSPTRNRLSSYLLKYLGAGTIICSASSGKQRIYASSWGKTFDFVIRQPRAGDCMCPAGLSGRTPSDHSICLVFLMQTSLTPFLLQEKVPAQTDQHVSGQQNSQRKGYPVLGTGQEGRRAEEGFACSW